MTKATPWVASWATSTLDCGMSAALRQERDGLLPDAALAGQVDLRAIEGAAQVAQGHLLRDQQSGAGVDPWRVSRRPVRLWLVARVRARG